MKNFLIGSLFLFALFLIDCDCTDLGSDPAKISISVIKEIGLEKGYSFNSWAPNGEYFAVCDSKYSTILYRKNGALFVRLSGVIKCWSKDSTNVLCIDPKLKRITIYNVLTGSKKELLFRSNEHCLAFFDDNSSLIYFRNESTFEFEFSRILKKDINSGIETTLFTTEPKLNGKILYDLKYFSFGKFFFSRKGKSSSGSIIKILYKVNLPKASEERINYLREIIDCIKLNDESIVFISTDEKGNYVFVNENLKMLGKISYDINNSFQNSEYHFVPCQTIILLDIALSPNGKVVFITKGTYGYDEAPIYESLYVYDFNGNSKKLSSIKPIHLLAVSPVGSQIAVLIENSLNIIDLVKVD